MKKTSTLCGLAAALALAPSLKAAAQTLTVTGTVFNDANGLTDNSINGNAVTNAVLPTGTTLYAALVNNSNQVASFTTVNLSAGANAGTYTLTGNTNTAYSVILTSAMPVINTNPVVGIPSSLAYTGEGTSAAGDGQVDGTVAISAGPSTSITVNFALDRRPQTVPATVNSVQYNANGRVIIPSTVFAGSDAEDGTYSNNLSGRKVDLFQATGGTLYYNNVAIVFQSANTATSILNFDPTKLTLAKDNDPQTGFSFSYSVRDNANIAELVASNVTASAAVLPMTLAAYAASREGKTNLIRWTTATEENTMGFSVERSTDGATFTELGRIPSQSVNGTSKRDLSYRFEDATADASQTVYYRIRETAFGGQTSLSPVMRVVASGEAAPKTLTLTPNPTNGPLQLTLWQGQPGDVSVAVINTVGRELYRETWTAGQGTTNHQLPGGVLPAGSYFLKVRTATGDQMAQSFTVLQ